VDRLQLQVVGGGRLLDHGVLLEAVGQLGVCRWGGNISSTKINGTETLATGPIQWSVTQRSVSVRNSRPKR
jgi:hypothetical protein